MKSRLTFGFVISIFLLMTQCDKFTYIEFLTKNNFILDSSAQEFDVKTKQSITLDSITINGNSFYIPNNIGYQGIDTIKQYDDYSLRYSTIGRFTGVVIGKWFNIKYLDNKTMHISIDENTENSERSLILTIFYDGPRSYINIRQKKEN